MIPTAAPEHISLLTSLVRYEPEKRLTAIEALAHPFFDEVRRGNGPNRAGPWQLHLPGGKPTQVDLFDFTELGAFIVLSSLGESSANLSRTSSPGLQSCLYVRT